MTHTHAHIIKKHWRGGVEGWHRKAAAWCNSKGAGSALLGRTTSLSSSADATPYTVDERSVRFLYASFALCLGMPSPPSLRARKMGAARQHGG